MQKMNKILVGQPEGRPFKRPSHRCDGDIKMGLREKVMKGVDLSHLAQDKGPLTGICELGNEPLCSTKCGQFIDRLNILLASQGLCSMELVLH
jgi:hypothetical protein